MTLHRTQDILDYYRQPTAMTSPGKHAALFRNLPNDIDELVRIVQRLGIYSLVTREFYDFNVPKEREDEIQIRTVEKMLDRILAMDDQPLTIGRPAEKRIVCLCRNFGLLLLSMLRAKNIPARGRCGYANYLIPGYYETHWICEYWDAGEERWKIVDVQLDEIFRKKMEIDFNILDIPRDRFLVVGDAWGNCRSGKADSSKFGYIPGHLCGLWHIAGNLVREMAALNKMEMLSWDIWGAQPKRDELIKDEQLAFFDELGEISREPDASFDNLRRLYVEDNRLSVPVTVYNSRLAREEII